MGETQLKWSFLKGKTRKLFQTPDFILTHVIHGDPHAGRQEAEGKGRASCAYRPGG